MKLREGLFDFAYIPNGCIEALANLAAAEDWGGNNWILRSCLKNLYKRVAQVCNVGDDISVVDIISVSASCVCFDTGLYTGAYERIFALLFTSNHILDKQPWRLQGLCREDDVALRSASPLPHRVIFYDDPAGLVFDARLKIDVETDHILGDGGNVSRSPRLRKAAANYMLAVPQLFTDKNSAVGKVQLLLPLRLTGDEPELALTLEHADGSCVARTRLTLPMAHNNARLINKPEAQWLAEANAGCSDSAPPAI